MATRWAPPSPAVREGRLALLLAFQRIFRCTLLGAGPGAAARACDLEQAPSSRWSLAAEGGVWWLKTPCDERFYSLGVNILDGGYPDRTRDGKVYYSWQAFAPTLTDWIGETRQRLAEWGFN